MPRTAGSCYKVITQDKQDEIIEVQASLMVGVAKEVSQQQVRSRGRNWNGTLGILNDSEVTCLIDSVHFLIDIEDSLYTLIAKSIATEQGLNGAKNSLETKKRSRRDLYRE